MRLAISTIILVTTASTVAIIELGQKNTGTIIPLTKRSPWLKPDKDSDALHFHAESVDAKTLHGLETYERNTGMPHPLAVKGTDLLLDLQKRAVGAAPLTGHNNLVWYGTIIIGTPPKSFTVDIDTGSSDLFVPGLACSGCSEHASWDPASSSTAEAKGSTFKITFDDGAIVLGDQYIDNVTIAGLSADVQTIGVATSYSTDMGFPPDGMLGLAFQSRSLYPASSLFETLVHEGKVTQPVFSLKVTSNGGEFQGYWEVNINEIYGNYQPILRDIPAIIDTGANLIVGVPSQVAGLHQTLGGQHVGNGYYSFPCDNFPRISFYFGGDRTFEIPASMLNMGPVQTGSRDCFSGIAGLSADGAWSLGAVFLQSVYTVFDFGNKQVGFADLV